MSIADVGVSYYSDCVQGERYAILSLRQIQRTGSNQETLLCLEVGRIENGVYLSSQLVVTVRDLYLISEMIHRYGMSTVPPKDGSVNKDDAEPTGDGPK